MFKIKIKPKIEVAAVITRANGRVEDRGIVARSVNPWRRWLLAAFALLALALLLSPVHAGVLFGATLLVNTGRAISTGLLTGVTALQPKYVGWGTGAGTTGATDTTLFTEAVETSTTRVTCTESQVTTTTTNDTAQYVGTITVITAGKTITNVGLFDAASGGNLFIKSDFTGLALNVGDSITLTFKVSQA